MTRRRVTAKGRGATLVRHVLLAAAAALAIIGGTGVAASAGSGVAQIGGTGTYDFDQEICDRGVAEIWLPIVITGDLNGCWYTDSFTGMSHPSGTYQETGTETFIGCLADGTTCGTFGTTYRVSAKFTPDGSEIFGRCQHPIVYGSGTEGFEGVSGRLDFKDDVDTGVFTYRGHLDGVSGSTSSATAAAKTSAVTSGC